MGPSSAPPGRESRVVYCSTGSVRLWRTPPVATAHGPVGAEHRRFSTEQVGFTFAGSLLGFLPVGEEAFEADVGHGVFPEFFEDGVGHGADVGAGGFEDVVGVTQAGGEQLSGEAVPTLRRSA